MSTTKDFIVEQIKEQITNFKAGVKHKTVGRVAEIGDGIAKVEGISEVMMSEMLEFKTSAGSVYGMALNLEEDRVGAIILGDYLSIKEGDEVRCLNKILEVPVGDKVIGRVVNPLGMPLDEG